MLKRFMAFYRPHRKLFALDMTSAGFRACFMMVVPFIVVRMLEKDKIQNASLVDIWQTIAVLALLVILMAVTEFINMKWGHILGTRIETAMRGDMFRHLQKLSFRYFDNTKTGHIMSRISNDLFTISELAHHAPEDLLISISLIIGSMSFMFVINWKLAIVVAIPLPILLLWGNFFRWKLRKTFREVRKRVADINSNVENSIQGIREVKSYAKEEYAIEMFDNVNNDFQTAKSKMYHTMASFHSGMMFLIEFYSVIIVAGGMLLVHAGQMQVVELLGFMMYRRYMFQPIRRLTGFMEQFQQGATAFERFVEIIEEDPEIQDRENTIELKTVQGDICVNGVSFKYSDDEDPWVLDDVTIRIQPGKTVALVGESGAGKSTMASLIPRFYEVQKGNITIDGKDIMDLRQSDLRGNVGIVQQNVFLFDTTIRENIIFGRPGASEEELISASKSAHIYDFIQSLPNGFDSIVGEHGVMLSGGQKQRISMARIFLKSPPILIFDEATSSLDTESEVLIQESLEELCAGRSTLVIAHRLSTVRHADYTYVMRDGKIVEEGTHADLIEKQGYYYDLYTRNTL